MLCFGGPKNTGRRSYVQAVATHVEERQEFSVKVIVVSFMFLNQQQWYLHSTSHQIHCCVATTEDVKDNIPLSVTSSHAKRT